MPPLVHHSLLFLHLVSAIVWVGGMFFAHFALRPSAAEVLQPPLRIALMTAALVRFFRFVSLAVAVIVLSGFGMLASIPLTSAPAGWVIMMFLGGVMALVFIYIYVEPFQQLRRHARESAWSDAASALGTIRQLVAFNLALGVAAVASAVSARG